MFRLHAPLFFELGLQLPTKSEIAVIPARPYYGDDSGILECLKAALDEVSTKLQVEITGESKEKKKK
jgi:hypothetical protein